ncbi:MAG: hypothetical protein AAGH48_08425 [Pseudomonadota bacterium]
MKLRTFIAPTLAQAKDKVRSVLGDDAVILSTASTPGGGVEIRAAIDASRVMRPAEPDKAAMGEAMEKRIADRVIAHLKKSSAKKPAPKAPQKPAEPEHIAALRSLLRAHKFGQALTDQLIEAAARTRTKDLKACLSIALDACFGYAPLPIVPARPIMLVGPTGVGKTSTAARLSVRARMSGEAANMFGADVSRAGAVEQIRTYADALKAAFWTVEGPEDMKKSLALTGLRGLIVIDSPGVNPYDPSELKYLQDLLDASAAEPVLVLPANGDRTEHEDVAEVFRALGTRRVILTKLDSARRLGAGLTAAHAHDLALAQFGLSPYIAEAVHRAGPELLADRLLTDLTGEKPTPQMSPAPSYPAPRSAASV